MKFKDVKENGKVVLEFSKEMMQIKDLKSFKFPYPAFDFFASPDLSLEGAKKKHGRRLQFTDDEYQQDNLVLDWDVLEMNEREIVFDLKFDEKYTLSQKQIFDRLYLQILDARNLVSTDGTLLTQTELEKE